MCLSKSVSQIFVVLLLAICISCNTTSSYNEQSSSNATVKQPSSGQAIYEKNCVVCHGASGDMGLSGATNLKTSTLSKEEVALQVKQGKKMMTAFEGILSPEEIEKVTEYTLTLRTNK